MIRHRHFIEQRCKQRFKSSLTQHLHCHYHHNCPGFPLYFGTEIQGPRSCIFKEQFSTKVYSMDNITAVFNIYFCDYGTVLVAKNKT